MAIMNAERSAALGVWLIVVPCYFLLCVFMYHLFNVRVGWFGAMFKMMASLEKTPYIDFLGPLILFVLPIICIIINVLAIIHVGVQRPLADDPQAKQISVTIKLKLWNIVLIFISLAVIFAFIAYVMPENISIR
jgi:hypothetical protein